MICSSNNLLDALLRLIFDFENIKDEIKHLSNLSSNAERDYLLKQCKDFIYHVSIFFGQGSEFEVLVF